MLVLNRKARQSIVLDGGITVTVLGVKGGQVQLGISAPPEVAVHREEVHQRIHQWTRSESSSCHDGADRVVV